MTGLTKVSGSTGSTKKDAYYHKIKSFAVGGTLTSTREAVHFRDNNMWYRLRTEPASEYTIPSSPNSDFVCLGNMEGRDLDDIRNFMGVLSDTDALVLAVNSRARVVIPKDVELYIKPIVLPDMFNIVLDGGIYAHPDLTGEVFLIKVKNYNGFSLTGNGFISGNEANCAATKMRLFRAEYGHRGTLVGITFRDNYIEEANYSEESGTVTFVGGSKHSLSRLQFTNWGLEGIWMQSVTRVNIHDVVCESNYGEAGGTRCINYSGVQCHGTKNNVSNIRTYNTGATAVGLDSTNSTMNNITVDKVRFGNGVGFGHPNKVSDGTVANNISVSNILDPTNVNSAGVVVANGSSRVTINNVYIKGSSQNGVNMSAGGKNVKINNIHLEDCARAIKMFGGDMMVSNMTTVNCVDGFVKQQASDKLVLSNVDLTGCTNKISGTESGVSGNGVVFDNTQPTTGVVQISSVSRPITVTNPNIRTWSKINILPTNELAATSLPFMATIASGSMTINTVNVPAHYSGVRYNIA